MMCSIVIPFSCAFCSADCITCSRAQEMNLLSLALYNVHVKLDEQNAMVLLVVRSNYVRKTVILYLVLLSFLLSQNAHWAEETNLQTMKELVGSFMFTDNLYIFTKVRGDDQNMFSWCYSTKQLQFGGSQEPWCNNMFSISMEVIPKL